MVNYRVLLVEDDKEIARLTQMYLEAEGYGVEVVYSGDKAVDAVTRCQPDVVLLDLMLPGEDGATVLKKLRTFYQGVVIVQTAVQEELSEVSLLKLGADDYLTKPIRGHILVARLEAHLRRYAAAGQEPSTHNYEAYGFKLCPLRKVAFYRSKNIDLTQAEFDILLLLVQSPDKAVSRDLCCQSSRGIEYTFNDRSIDMRISGLRRKLARADVNNAQIKTIRNQGYMLTAA
ncbi:MULTISPECIES: response regulator transcription factor [Vibrio]|uniref:response regulator transcription factor n=1 Tax=Vibrio TaxID=662 RepID=UPI002ED90F3F